MLFEKKTPLEKMEKERIISLFKNQGFHVLISA